MLQLAYILISLVFVGMLGQIPPSNLLQHTPLLNPLADPLVDPPPLMDPSVDPPVPVDTTPGIKPPSFIPAIPPKLLKKILEAKHIEMSELLPNSWRSEELDPLAKSLSCRQSVTDIMVWMECFCTLAAVIASKYLDKSPQLFAYARTIVRASRNFEGLAWASYDSSFRRQAATRHNYDWSTIDHTLYSEAFTGRARIKARCHHCLSDTHPSDECPLIPPHLFTQSRGAPASRAKEDNLVEICDLFNKEACRYRRCRFAHICGKCKRRPHPAPACPMAQGK